MIYIDTASFDPCFNFGVEYWLCTEKKFSDTVFLLWGTDPCVMLGRFQNLACEVNRPYVEQNGVILVRRMSGGGAIYTDRGGRQFTFIEPAEGGITFEKYLRIMVGALRRMGFPVEASGRNDLLCYGRKCSGNAQYRLGGMCVHHGSLLYDTDLAALAAATTPDPEKLRSKGVASVRERVCNLREFAPAGMDTESFARALAAECLGRGERYTLTEADRAACAALGEQYFRDPAALYGGEPRLSRSRTGRFAGGSLTAEVETRGGVLLAVSFSGDVFGEDPAPLCEALRGIPYTADALRAAVTVSPFYRITPEEVLSLLLP